MIADPVATLIDRLPGVTAASAGNARVLDERGEFPDEDVAALTHIGALAAVVPSSLGGLGIGTEAEYATATAEILYCIGAGSVALGRIYEGHINALRLLMLHGTPAQRQVAAADALAGELFALWVTDGAESLSFTMTSHGIALHGDKQFCSAAGHATRAVVTAREEGGARRLMLLPLGHGEHVTALPAPLQGVRAAVTGRVDFTGVRHAPECLFGAPNAYLAEPEFSAGAWRACAIAAGAQSALVEAVRDELVARNRADSPLQRARLGRMMTHAQTARLWLKHAAPLAEAAKRQPELAVATVNLMRHALESACLDTIQLAQRTLGLSALQRGNPVERIGRDLATYLRQPAPDEALHEATGYFIAHPYAGGFR
ncbi:MAG TPA: acyl-CoA dehydrogenase family protein [Acetobacteraceae bacterium]|nr:acyl-CoA dehydrogenase family protein [Acetobacteraceae bacterium]